LNSATGHVRAYAFLHNAPLPDSGSFQERLLSEVIIRERNAQYAMVSLLARLIAAGAGVEPRTLGLLLEEYREELFQLRYNPRYKSVSRVMAEQEMSKIAEETRLMRRVAAMTVSDEELAAGRNRAKEIAKNKRKKAKQNAGQSQR